jgi:hypothetical protein
MFPLCKSRHAAMTVVTVACSFSPAAFAQAPDPSCPPPLCVSRTDDHAARAVPGMLRYAVDHADDGAVITFHPALRGQKILLDGATPGNHIRISRHLTVQGPGADLLTISGGGKTRIFCIAGVTVHLHGLTLSDGFARGGDGAPGAGAGGGGGGLGGAIFVSSGFLYLLDTRFEGNACRGGNGAPGAVNGQAKGGALFVCSRAFCGASHDAAAVFSGTTSFAGNTAEDAGLDPKCPGRDDSDLCGHLSDPVPARFSIAAPPSVNAGEEFSILVTAIDRNDRIVPAFNGEVHLTITDGAVSIPLEATLTRGLTWLTVSLSQAGRQTITALSAAEPSIRGSAALRVQPATPDH